MECTPWNSHGNGWHHLVGLEETWIPNSRPCVLHFPACRSPGSTQVEPTLVQSTDVEPDHLRNCTTISTVSCLRHPNFKSNLTFDFGTSNPKQRNQGGGQQHGSFRRKKTCVFSIVFLHFFATGVTIQSFVLVESLINHKSLLMREEISEGLSEFFKGVVGLECSTV